jgi:hypothetical protein
MMINSNTRFSSRSFISLRLEFSKVGIEIWDGDRELSNWFESESSFWRKTVISVKFWYLSEWRLARVGLVIANDLVISKGLAEKLF